MHRGGASCNDAPSLLYQKGINSMWAPGICTLVRAKFNMQGLQGPYPFSCLPASQIQNLGAVCISCASACMLSLSLMISSFIPAIDGRAMPVGQHSYAIMASDHDTASNAPISSHFMIFTFSNQPLSNLVIVYYSVGQTHRATLARA